MDINLLFILFIAVLASNANHVHVRKQKQAKDPKPTKAEAEKLELKKHHLESIEETQVDPDLVLKFKAGDWHNSPASLKKWVLCVLDRLGLMSKEGVYRLDEAMAKVAKQDAIKVEALIDDCLSTKAIPPPDIAWEYLKCLHIKDPNGNFTSISILQP